ncbi:MAG: hypothetical protein AAF570_11030, partial [Bacteroidota bacterium]
RDFISRMTVEFSALMDQVRDAIKSIGIGDLAKDMEKTLEDFNKNVMAQANAVFAPVRNVLTQGLQTLNKVLTDLDPQIIIDSIQGVLSQFTQLLSNPQLIDAIEKVKKTVDDVNGEIQNFSFKPGTVVVVEAINVVEKALKTAGKIPSPDPLRPPIQLGLQAIPADLNPPVNVLLDKFDKLIDDKVKPFLDVVESGPKKLVAIVEEYSPQKLIGDCLSNSYQAMLNELARFKPSDLLTPVQNAIDGLKDKILEAADPSKLLEPLQGPFDALMNLIRQFDPMALLAPLNEKLQQGIHLITDNLPLQPVNDAFDAVQQVATQVEKAKNTLTSLRDIGQSLQTKLNGLNNAEQQITTLGTDIAAKIGQISDISPVQTAMNNLGTALDDMAATPLKAQLDPVVQTLRTRLTALNAKTKLVRLLNDYQGFPRADLEALPGSTTRTGILEFLDSFNPVDAEFAGPVDFLDRWGAQLESARTAFGTALDSWDDLALKPNGPLRSAHSPINDAAALQTLLTQTIEKQLTETLKPVFKALDHFRTSVNGILGHVTTFLNEIADIVQDLLDITNALEEVRTKVNGLFEDLTELDLEFVAEEIAETFDLVLSELEAVSPRRIGQSLKKAFGDLLGVMDVKKLLGAGELDTEFLRIVESLRKFDPGQIIIKALQPTYDALLELLKKLDISKQVAGFKKSIDHLKKELRKELNRCVDEFEKMWQAVPSVFEPATIRASATVSTT